MLRDEGIRMRYESTSLSSESTSLSSESTSLGYTPSFSLPAKPPPPPSPCWEWGRCRFAQQQLTSSSCSSVGAHVPVCTGWPPSSSSCSYSSSSGRSSSHSSWSSPVLPQLTPLWQAVHVSFLVSVYAPVSGRGLLLSSVGTGSISPFSLGPWL